MDLFYQVIQILSMSAPSYPAGSWPSFFISRTARCDAAKPSNVMVRVGRPLTLMALRKNAFSLRRHRAYMAQAEVHGSARAVDRPGIYTHFPRS